MKNKFFTRQISTCGPKLAGKVKGMVIHMKHIGVLALQGAFAEHKIAIQKLGAVGVEIRQKSDLLKHPLDGVILPGGESTVIGKLLRELDMMSLLQQEILDGLPVFGTCAGLILLAREVTNDPLRYIATMDIIVKRNAYGRQLGSFFTEQPVKGIGNFPMTFIRAPYIEQVDTAKGCNIMAQTEGHIVAARQRNMLVTAFHPELTQDLRFHEYFLSM